MGREDRSTETPARRWNYRRGVVLRPRQALRLSCKPKIFPLDAAVEDCDYPLHYTVARHGRRSMGPGSGHDCVSGRRCVPGRVRKAGCRPWAGLFG